MCVTGLCDDAVPRPAPSIRIPVGTHEVHAMHQGYTHNLFVNKHLYPGSEHVMARLILLLAL